GRPERYFRPRDIEIRRRLRKEVGIPPDAVLCFTAARIDPVKGFSIQLAAIERLRDSPVWSNLAFAWAGSGKQFQELADVLRKRGLTASVKLIGHRWDVEDWLDAADMFVLPSFAEGMPLAVIEAMAKGLPVAASIVSGLPEELGSTGQLLPDPR